MAALLPTLTLLVTLVAQDGAPRSATSIVLASSPAIDLYFHVRSVAASGGKTTVEAFQPAVEAAQELDRTLGGSFLAWGPLEGLLPGCASAADVQRAFAEAPLTLELRPGTSVPLREGALKLAAALVAAEPAFAEPWQRRSARIAAARERWQRDVAPREQELLGYHLRSLNMRDPGLAIPVQLVAEAPAPGAVTHRGRNGQGVCFVAVDGAAGSQLYETILHEATHALDVASNNDSVLGELRAVLEGLGFDARDRRLRDLPHTLMFVQSGESIRRIIDPAHRDYGEVARYYERIGKDAQTLRGYWGDHLEGRMERSEAIAQIGAAVLLNR